MMAVFRDGDKRGSGRVSSHFVTMSDGDSPSKRAKSETTSSLANAIEQMDRAQQCLIPRTETFEPLSIAQLEECREKHVERMFELRSAELAMLRDRDDIETYKKLWHAVSLFRVVKSSKQQQFLPFRHLREWFSDADISSLLLDSEEISTKIFEIPGVKNHFKPCENGRFYKVRDGPEYYAIEIAGFSDEPIDSPA